MLNNKEKKLSITYSLAFSTLLLSLLQIPCNAANKQSYIVYLGEGAPNVATIQSLSDDATSNNWDADQLLTSAHYALLASVGSSSDSQKASGSNGTAKMLYSYTKCMNGFAAVLEEEEAQKLRANQKVKAVFPNKKYDLHTTHSWEFLGVESHGVATNGALWSLAKYGQDVIIGNLDTGAWPESASFDDTGMGPVPARWKGNCTNDGGFKCNKKLIGGRYFNKGAEAAAGAPLDKDLLSVRDDEGHGTHTLSTAGGGFAAGASVFGYGNGTAKGGSPKARVAAYKVCWSIGCFAADILAGFDAALKDGVDIISASIGGSPVDLYLDPTAIGAFNAIKRGVSVIASAGNSGPVPESLSNLAPWFFTVGASSMDREFISTVHLGNKLQFKGKSLSNIALPAGKLYPLISGVDAQLNSTQSADALTCSVGSLDKTKVKGKIVICLRGGSSRVEKGQVLADLGAVGMILANDELSGNLILADPHFIPASHVSYKDGQTIFKYAKSPNATATLSPVVTGSGIKPSPVMASFSSRGPNPLFKSLLKPDITAPGVDIIAAFPDNLPPSARPTDKRRLKFNVMSGTSMSCPHISGIVGLIKSVHPTWSPAAIKSAIMTTATTRANNGLSITDSDGTVATPFAYGAGHVHPRLAINPGLVYDLTVNDYLNSLCAFGYNDTIVRGFAQTATYTCPKNFSINDFNYPSIAVPDLSGSVVVTRRLKNVGTPAVYKAHVTAPTGVSVVVQPPQLAFTKAGEEKGFKVVFKASANVSTTDYVYGQIEWSDGKHFVRSPIVVKSA